MARHVDAKAITIHTFTCLKNCVSKSVPMIGKPRIKCHISRLLITKIDTFSRLQPQVAPFF
ncbi:MAG TPA: hypothetical protein DE045_12310 [Oceanospirillaceae bacterium]|nr:hypothetical protein [Oceanospirillaceae bacterium]